MIGEKEKSKRKKVEILELLVEKEGIPLLAISAETPREANERAEELKKLGYDVKVVKTKRLKKVI